MKRWFWDDVKEGTASDDEVLEDDINEAKTSVEEGINDMMDERDVEQLVWKW